MLIDKIISDSHLLNKQIAYFTKTKRIQLISSNPELVQEHIKKARHNMAFYNANKRKVEFNDWLVVILYYTLYHVALALITNKFYRSKNHQATLLLLIKEYSISADDARLIEELALTKDDAHLYTQLKQDRHDASYATATKFTNQLIERYELHVIEFINKAESMLIT